MPEKLQSVDSSAVGAMAAAVDAAVGALHAQRLRQLLMLAGSHRSVLWGGLLLRFSVHVYGCLLFMRAVCPSMDRIACGFKCWLIFPAGTWSVWLLA